MSERSQVIEIATQLYEHPKRGSSVQRAAARAVRAAVAILSEAKLVTPEPGPDWLHVRE